ncbi:MAG: phosphoglycerate kinase [Flavobacteriales bacterium]|nr:phosphoglycerate kinase [Flavobacteriales bacterium]|tara:strand:- start:22345 stop:23535 length:1191 start_codon:yes stop_codon:yes gene_type:complete
MNSLNQVSLKGKRVLVRVDFNVPLDDNYTIMDDSRIVAALPTIKKIIADGGRAIVMSHLGRPKKGFEKRFSLNNIVGHLSALLSQNIYFSSDCIGRKTILDVNKMNDGDVLVLENLRFYAEEEKGDVGFANQLANLADIYINDAFGTAHRAHASTAVIAKFFPKNKYFGYLLGRELESLEKALASPKRPFTAIIGGAKITGKIDVIKALFNTVDNLIIGGGMAYTFIKAMGGVVGKSLVEEEKISLAKELIEESRKKSVRLLLPTDSLNADSFNNNAKTNTSNIFEINNEYMGLDIGKESITEFSKTIKESKTLIWNGPMGVFEMEKFEKGTKKIGEAICFATNNGAFSLVGGGDSVAAIKKFGFAQDVSYVSTGGGAMLEYLEGKPLPGITAIQN